MEDESLVAMVLRHVREGNAHIEKQRGIIAHLSESNLPTEEARHLLALFEATQADHKRHLDQIVEQQRAGEREGDGNLVNPDASPLT